MVRRREAEDLITAFERGAGVRELLHALEAADTDPDNWTDERMEDALLGTFARVLTVFCERMGHGVWQGKKQKAELHDTQWEDGYVILYYQLPFGPGPLGIYIEHVDWPEMELFNDDMSGPRENQRFNEPTRPVNLERSLSKYREWSVERDRHYEGPED